MGKIIAVTNQKGGVGKTTTAVNLAACLGELDKKVLIVDLDPQGNATISLGLYPNDINNSVYEVITGKCDPKDAIMETKFKNLFVMPAAMGLAGVDMELANMKDREKQLSHPLEKIRKYFDFIIIDCPPSLGVLNTNALTAADSLIIPIQPEFFALQGVTQLLMTIKIVIKRFNPRLQVEGVLITMYDKRTVIMKEVAMDITRNFHDKVYKTVITKDIRIVEASSKGEPICYYKDNRKGSGCKNYRALAKEVVANNGK